MGKKRQKSGTPAAAPPPPVATTPRRPGRGVLIGVVAAIVVAIVGGYLMLSGRAPSYASGAFKDYNVVLITLDTTRADHLPVYGYRGVRTPGLDRLAENGIVFDNAIAHVPLTLPSHTSILTGLLPIAHGVRDNEGYQVDPKLTTLTEILKGRGYRTAAFVSAFVLDARFGLDRGFDLYYDEFNRYQEVNRDDIQRRAEETEAQVERWLPAQKGHPFFLWVHFYDPHDPYDPPEPFHSSYAANRYDGEIAYMDQSVERLLAALRESGVAEKTIVIATGDHGEGLGEHGELTHAMFLYRTTLRVPLIVSLPGGRARRVAEVVRHIDLAPTILDFLGIPAVEAMQGESLLPVINGREGDDRAAYSESLYAKLHYGWSPLAAVTERKYELIDAPKAELYDSAADPSQKRNLLQEKPEVAADLRDRMGEIVATLGRTDLAGPKKMDADTEQKLRSLGYLGSAAQATTESLKVDPKDKLAVINAVTEGVKAFSGKDFQRALQWVLPVTESDPGLVEARYVAGASFAYMQLYDQAIDQLLKAIALRADHTMALATLGWAYQGQGNLAEAERWYQKALAQEEDNSFTLVKLASLYREMRRPAQADEYFAKAVAPVNATLETTTDPEVRARLFSIRAESFLGAGRLPEAAGDLQAAIALTPRAPELHFNLAQVYERQNDVARAIAAYEAETEVSPSSFDAYMNLGMLNFNVQRYDAAASCYQALGRIAPGDPRPGVLLAEAYMRMGAHLDEAMRLAERGLQQMGESSEIYALIGSIEQRRGNARQAAEAFARSQALRR